VFCGVFAIRPVATGFGNLWFRATKVVKSHDTTLLAVNREVLPWDWIYRFGWHCAFPFPLSLSPPLFCVDARGQRQKLRIASFNLRKCSGWG